MDTTLQQRQDFLFNCVDRLFDEYAIWSDDHEVQGLPMGGPMWMAAEDCVKAFHTGTIPGSCRNLLRAMDEFSQRWREHTHRAEVSPQDNLTPGNGLWAALRGVQSARQGTIDRGPVQLESVADLVEQGLNDVQIAKIYEWKTPTGSWDLDKVRDAKRNPGRYDGEAHLRQQQAAQREQEQQEQEQYSAMQQRASSKPTHAPQPGPEAIELLLERGNTVGQVAKIKVIDVESVLAYCDSAGIPLNGRHSGATMAVSAADAHSPQGDGQQTVEVPDDVDFGEFADDLGNMGNSATQFDGPPKSDFDDELPGGDLDDQDSASQQGEVTIEDKVAKYVEIFPGAKPGQIADAFEISSQKATAVLKKLETAAT